MAKYSPYLCAAIAALGFAANAGDNAPLTAPRKEFHQQRQYPFVFEPVAYLEARGPAPMRFGEPANDSSRHVPPALPTPTPAPSPVAAKPADIAPPNDSTRQKAQSSPTNNQQSSPAVTPSPLPAQQSPPSPDYPPPMNAQSVPSANQPDFTQMPDEVLEYFKNPYYSVPNARRLFDPIFEPAVIHKAPRSKATYKQE